MKRYLKLLKKDVYKFLKKLILSYIIHIMNKGGCKTGRKGETPNGGCKIGKKNPTKTRERRRANTPQLESLPTTPIDRPKKKQY